MGKAPGTNFNIYIHRVFEASLKCSLNWYFSTLKYLENIKINNDVWNALIIPFKKKNHFAFFVLWNFVADIKKKKITRQK